MEGSNRQLYISIPKEMKNSCRELTRRIDKYAEVKLISKNPNQLDKYVGETLIREYISRAQYDSFSLFGPNVLTIIRDHFKDAVESTSKRLNLTPEALLSIIGKLNSLSEEVIDTHILQLASHEPPKEYVEKHRSSPSLSPSPPPETFPPEDINADINDLLIKIESLVFYDCLRLHVCPN